MEVQKEWAWGVDGLRATMTTVRIGAASWTDRSLRDGNAR